MEYYTAVKGMKYWYTQQYDKSKKQNQTKRVHAVWFFLYKILENTNESIITESRSVVAWR